ncbi:MAG TPA: hypothetical protein VF017_02880 [Thermoanaerobaculia bacterium]|nr:hypothetical protein [Thermoanaerobaculia bacterium]
MIVRRRIEIDSTLFSGIKGSPLLRGVVIAFAVIELLVLVPLILRILR